MKIPEIKIELVHIDGPFKGTINEYVASKVSLGRHPDCDLVFPEDLRGISRRHAEIRREGNRFLLRDTSKNGTFVNGKLNPEVFLKNGDVLILGEGGPKISFLSTVVAEERPREKPAIQPPIDIPADIPIEPVRKTPISSPPQKGKRLFSESAPKPPSVVPEVQKTLVIQHGAAIKVFKKLPITIGRDSDCDFIISTADILGKHAQVYFENNQYWIKDLTGRSLVVMDSNAVQTMAPLRPNCRLSLTADGPDFEFLGDGRLVEVQGGGEKSPQRAAPSSGLRRQTGSGVPKKKKRRLLLVVGIVVLGAALATGLYFFWVHGSVGGGKIGGEIMDKVQQIIRKISGKE